MARRRHAESASKSDQYAPPATSTDKPQWMFIARAVLGAHHLTKVGLRGIVRPPDLPGTRRPADSVVYDNLAGGKFREFIVYENSLAYPEYLVRYERWAGGRKVS